MHRGVWLQTNCSLKPSAHYWLEQIGIFLEHGFWFSLTRKESHLHAMRLIRDENQSAVRKDIKEINFKTSLVLMQPRLVTLNVGHPKYNKVAVLFSSWQPVWRVLYLVSSYPSVVHPTHFLLFSVLELQIFIVKLPQIALDTWDIH